MAALKSGLRIAFTLSPIEPLRTSGTFGSTISMEYGHSSTTVTANLSTSRFHTFTLLGPITRTDICVKSEGTLALGSAILPVTSASLPAGGASGLAVKRTGTVT